MDYPENFLAWRREQDEERWAARRHEAGLDAPFQAIVDRVMRERDAG